MSKQKPEEVLFSVQKAWHAMRAAAEDLEKAEEERKKAKERFQDAQEQYNKMGNPKLMDGTLFEEGAAEA